MFTWLGLATPVHAAEPIELNAPAVRSALHAYGWKPEAIYYLQTHMRLVATDGHLSGACPGVVACTTPAGVLYLNLSITDAPTFNYVINHEMIHAMQFARGGREAMIGGQLADLLALSSDQSFPLAAAAARRILGLAGDGDYPVLDQHDWFHMDHDLLQDVGWDVANLPPWFRDAYFPFLNVSPAAATRPRGVADAAQPSDEAQRRQRVIDTIATMCGPSMPGVQLLADSPKCSLGELWPASPYPAYVIGGKSAELVAASGPTPPPDAPNGWDVPAAGAGLPPTGTAGPPPTASD